MNKKFFYLPFLALLMALSLYPATALADGDEDVAKVGDTTYASVSEAIAAAASGDTVTLLGDVSDVVIPANANVILDLNGHNVSSGTDHAITNNGVLTVVDNGGGESGKVDGGETSAKGALYNAPGATANLNGGIFTGSKWYVIKNLGEMTINGASVIQNHITSSAIDNGFYGNKSNDCGESPAENQGLISLTISSGSVSGGINCVKNDDYGKLTISGGEFTTTASDGAVIMNWNEASISGGTFTGNGTSAVVSNNYATGGADAGKLTISGGDFIATNDGDLFGTGADESGAETTISGGTFTGTPNEVTEVDITVTGAEASFSNTIPAAYTNSATVVENEDGTYSIGFDEETAVATLNGVGYTTLQGALDTAASGDTVTLLTDVTANSNVWINTSGVTLDLNGKTVTSANQIAIAVDSGVTATVENGTLIGGTVSAVYTFANVDLTIKDCKLTGGTSCTVYNNGGNTKLTLEGCAVTSAEGGGGIWDWGAKNSVTLTDCEVSGDYFAIYHNGNTGGFSLTATNSTITAIEGSQKNACAIYVSGSVKNTSDENDGKNSIKLEGCTVTGPTGIEGKYTNIELTDCTVTATAEISFEQNNDGSTALGFAVVSTDNTMVPNSPKPEANVTINSGEYVGLIGLSHFEEVKETDGFQEATYVVHGGYFSESVADYVDDSLKAELISGSDTETPYSYYSDVEAAKEAAGPADLVVDLSEETGGDVQILGVGFDATADGANNAMTAIIKNLGGSSTVSDCDVNTMWAFVQLTDEPANYTLTVADADGNTVYKSKDTELQNAKGINYVYFTFNLANGGSPAAQAIASGVYTITLSTGEGDDVKTATAEIALAEVSYNLNGGSGETPEATYYTAGTEIELAAKPTRNGYTFGGWYVNNVSGDKAGDPGDAYQVPEEAVVLIAKWTSNGGGGSSSSAYTVTVDSAKNGSVSVSPKNASRNTTVTITVTPDEGYELDSLTVTDKNGDSVKLTRKSDTQYTFTMPASRVTVSAAFKEADAESDSPSKSFADVDTSSYYYDAVEWAVENGITQGTSATAFSPDAACTRAQMVTFLWRAAGSPAPTASANPFTDVKSGEYYYDAVLWAVEKGVTEGTSATTFSPDAIVTRGQTVTLLYRYAGSPDVSDGASFSDVPAGAYYANAVQWAVANEVTNGTSATTFSPESDCTRAQIVTFLYRNLVG